MDSVQMQEAILQHWGIKGMKWGMRRYQNKDGSLTPEGRKRYSDSDGSDGFSESKMTRKLRKGRKTISAEDEVETVEQKREKLLKSSDAVELYKNRDLLTTAEINERLNRIDTERRLAKVMEETQPAKKTVLDRVDTALKVGRKINEVYEFTNTPVMKALKKKMGLATDEESDKTFNIKKLYENRDKLSDKDVQNAANRAENYNKLKRLYDDVTSESSNKDNNQSQSQNKPTNESGNKPDSKPVNNTSSTPTDSGKKKSSSEPFSANSVSESAKKLADEFDNNKTSKALKSYTDDITKKMDRINQKKISDAKTEIRDAVDSIPKSDTLKKAAAVEIAKEVGPELGEVISTFNDAMIAANQKRLDEQRKNN